MDPLERLDCSWNLMQGHIGLFFFVFVYLSMHEKTPIDAGVFV